MAIKGPDLIFIADQVVASRLQTAGPGQINLSPKRLYELGNYKSTGIEFDIPDISSSMDSWDASISLEQFLTGGGSISSGSSVDIAKNVPFDMVSQFKRGVSDANQFDVYGSCILPFMTLESLSYKFGLKEDASITATVRGDTIYYSPNASAFVQRTTGTNAANQAIILSHHCYQNNDDVISGARYALGVKLKSGKRLTLGTDYTENAVIVGSGPTYTVTVTILAAVPTTDAIDIIYTSDTVANYPQNTAITASATKPASIRGKDIKVYVGGEDISHLWDSIQGVQVDWKVNLDKDYEFGNTQLVAQDFFVPEVSGNIVLKPKNYADLFAKLQTISQLATPTEVAGALRTGTTELLIVLHSPTDGTVLKTLKIPDARLQVPGFGAQVQQKLTMTVNWDSDSGTLLVYNGLPTGLSGL